MQRLLALATLTHLVCAPDDAGAAGGGAGGAATGGAGSAPAPKPADAGADVNAMRSENETLRKQLADFQKAQADSAAAAETEKRKQLEEQGQHKTLAEQFKAENETLKKQLADLKGDADLGKSFREKEAKKIDEAAKGLSAGDKAILDKLPDLESKAAFIARVTGTAENKPQHQPAQAAGASPAPNSVVDIDVVIKEHGAEYARTKHPKEWDEHIARRSKGASQPKGMFAGLFGRA